MGVRKFASIRGLFDGRMLRDWGGLITGVRRLSSARGTQRHPHEREVGVADFWSRRGYDRRVNLEPLPHHAATRGVVGGWGIVQHRSYRVADR
jgi:hypothetical protein